MKWLSIFALAFFALAGTVRGGEDEPVRLLLISQGPDGHPWNTHEFRAGVRILSRMLADAPNLNVTTIDAGERPQDIPAQVDASDGVVLFVSEGAKWVGSDPQRLAAFRRLVDRQGGVTALHWAVGAKDAKFIETGRSLWGGVHGGPDRKYVVDRKTITPNAEHPITAGLEPLTIRDEWYYWLKFASEGTITPLWTTTIDEEPQTVSWAWERPDRGRSFGFVGLHFHENWGEEAYRRFITRGVLWTVGLEEPKAGLPLEFERKDLEKPR
ncbi:MAG: ThuA domain-containing protein [Planctomycetaceae bacterium]